MYKNRVFQAPAGWYSRYFRLDVTQGKPGKYKDSSERVTRRDSRDVVSLPFLLPVCLRSLRLVMDPHLPPQVITTDASLLQILDDCFPSFLTEQVRSRYLQSIESSTFQLERAPFLWLALVLSLDLITITPLSVGLSCKGLSQTLLRPLSSPEWSRTPGAPCKSQGGLTSQWTWSL